MEGSLFDLLGSFDQAFNQAPSLHISLLLLLWCCYTCELKTWPLWARCLLHAWLGLIGISVFTTWQHHVIDGVGGAVVALLCCYLLPHDTIARTNFNPGETGHRRHLALRYLLAALCCWLPAYVCGGWLWLMLWPGFALVLVALAYAGMGEAIFQKQAGRIHWAAQWVLAPYRLGAWISSRILSRHDAAQVEIVPGIWLGRAMGRREEAAWRATHGPKAAVLDLTAEFNANPQTRMHPYVNIPMLDLLAPSVGQLAQAVQQLDHLQQRGVPVYVHCALGYSRSALVVAAWLMQRGLAASTGEAVTMIKSKRPHCVFSRHGLDVLAT